LDNIEINGILLGLRKEQLAAKLKSIIEFADLGNFITAPVRTYSSGMRARLGFSVAVHVDPEILVVDEVLGVGDASFRRRSTDKIRELFEKGTTVVMVQHDMRTIADLCHRVMWLEKGRVQMIDEPLSVVNAYLESRGLPALPGRP
jgi:ABC-type polysaccharide/polyol phosphate transport system ATPase subunit